MNFEKDAFKVLKDKNYMRLHYARFVVIRLLFVKKIVSELTPIDTNIK